MNTVSRFPLWRIVFWLIMAAGIVAGVSRFYYGLGATTNLSDRFPWGIWVGFDVLCGVGLAAGGFTLAAMVHLFNIKAYKPIVRPGDSDRVPGLHAGGRWRCCSTWAGPIASGTR